MSFRFPKDKIVDVIIDTDAKNEADDQFAIVHALLTKKFNVKGIVATHFGTRRTERSMMESYEECERILDIMNMKNVPLFKGNERSLTQDTNAEQSEGTDFIVETALSIEKTLYILCFGALTNVAAALKQNENIKDKICIIWVGGCDITGGRSYMEANARNDYMAVNVVMKMCDNLIQIPREVYSLTQASLTELELKVKPYGAIGNYLFEQLEHFNYEVNRPWAMGESWGLGDSTAVSLLINPMSVKMEQSNPVQINEKLEIVERLENKNVMVVKYLDTRFMFEDFFAKLVVNSKDQ